MRAGDVSAGVFRAFQGIPPLSGAFRGLPTRRFHGIMGMYERINERSGRL